MTYIYLGRSRYGAIERDQRWPAMLKKLQATGFGFPVAPMEQVTLADFMMRAVNGTHDLNQPRFLAWMAVVSQMYYGYIYAGQVEPIMEAFPDARFAEYDAVMSSPSHCIPNSNGIMFCSVLPTNGSLEPGLSASSAVFNSQNSAMYMVRFQLICVVAVPLMLRLD